MRHLETTPATGPGRRARTPISGRGFRSRSFGRALAVLCLFTLLGLVAMGGCSPLTAIEPGGPGDNPGPGDDPGSGGPDPGNPGTPAAEGIMAVSRVPTEEKVVAFTFDAGSDAGHTQAILDILAERGITATFFLTGAWLERYPELGRAILEAGHALGNHTYTHPHLTELSDEDVLAEIGETDARAEQALGRSLAPLFRPPYGEIDERVTGLVAQRGYRYVIMWTLDSLDWKMIPPDELRSRVVDGVVPGAIILMHVGSETYTPEALPEILDTLAGQGYRFVTVPELITKLPAGAVFHTVAPGETLSAVARLYGVEVADILAANELDDPDQIQAGQVLLIPVPDQGD